MVAGKFFITATGTEIGKTFVTTTLCKQLINSGKKVAAFKPVISGYNSDDNNSDTALILNSLGLGLTQENIEKISPWRFSAPLAPNMAAKMEKREIFLDDLIKFCKEQEKLDADILLVEGVGGAYVPLNSQYTVLDWMAGLDGWKIILVAGSYLGSISHTLTAMQVLLSRSLNLHTLIVSESENSSVDFSETIKTLSHFLPESVSIVPLPRYNSPPDLSAICL